MEADGQLTIIDPYAESIAAGEFDDTPGHFPYVHYPPYSATYLRDFLSHLMSVSAGDPSSFLASLTELSLYVLAAALGSGLNADGISPDEGMFDALIAELRWRDCKSMGEEPRGAVRRGRLIQLAGTCTALETVGASSLQRHNLAGACPFCGDPDFRVFLPTVSWRCFGCGRQGALLEFAECLLTAGRTPPA